MPRSRNIRRERKTKKSPPEFPFGRQKEKEEKNKSQKCTLSLMDVAVLSLSPHGTV
jgi:hypothetical protein